jgi:alpha-L-fucosidase
MYKRFGREVQRRFGKSIAETAGEGGSVELVLPREQLVDHIITMEDIREGERVREYVLEALVRGKWRKVRKGISIGHKRIDAFPAVRASAMRLRVTRSVAKPLIRRLAAYHCGIIPRWD